MHALKNSLRTGALAVILAAGGDGHRRGNIRADPWVAANPAEAPSTRSKTAHIRTQRPSNTWGDRLQSDSDMDVPDCNRPSWPLTVRDG